MDEPPKPAATGTAAETAKPLGGNWAQLAARRLGAFLLAVGCGIAVPLSPIGAERFVTGQVEPVSWFAVSVTYVAGIGLVSKSQSILVLSLLAAFVLAFIYGVDMERAYDASHRTPALHIELDPSVAIWMIGMASFAYLAERVGRHLVDGKPFLEG